MTSAVLWRRRKGVNHTKKGRKATQPSLSGQASPVLDPLLTMGSGHSPGDLGYTVIFFTEYVSLFPSILESNDRLFYPQPECGKV